MHAATSSRSARCSTRWPPGKRAFRGESRVSTLAAIMEKDPPPPSEISSTSPPELDRLIARCLRKDVNRRSQNMADVKLALEELRDESESGKLARPVAAAEARSRRWLWPAMRDLVRPEPCDWATDPRGRRIGAVFALQAFCDAPFSTMDLEYFHGLSRHVGWPRSFRANARRSARPRPPRLGTALYLRGSVAAPASLLRMRRSILRFSMVIIVRLRYQLLLGPGMLPGVQVCSARRIAQHRAQRAGVWNDSHIAHDGRAPDANRSRMVLPLK
jgi:hypothetical protein